MRPLKMCQEKIRVCFKHKTNFASNTSSRQHRIIIAEIHRNRGKPRNKHDRRAEHIDFDIKEKIKLDEKEINEKIMKTYQNESNMERIERIWKSTKNNG